VVSAEFSSFDELDEGGNDGDFLVCGDEIEDFGVDAVDARELVGARVAVGHFPNVGDLASINRNMESWPVILNREGGGIV